MTHYTSDLDVYSSSAGLEVRPDVVPGQPCICMDRIIMEENATIRAFVAPANIEGEGTLGRNVLRGSGAWQIDFALHRQFRSSERIGLQFRAEAFNILNHPNFANLAWDATRPNRDSVGASGFGLSSATLASTLGPSGTQGELNSLFKIGGPRTFQFALRLNF